MENLEDLLEKKQIDNDKYILYAPNTLKYIYIDFINILEQKLKHYLEFFRVLNFRKIQINLFDNKQKFRNYIIKLRNGDEKSLPSYAIGVFDKGMINMLVDPNIIIGSPKYIKTIHSGAHELGHIMYKELIWKNNENNRIVWFDEGLIQNLSGEKDTMNFKIYLNNVISKTKIIPDLSLLSHGDSFVNENYNGYDLSYIAVRYLFETLTADEMNALLYDFQKQRELGKHIINTAINYFSEQENNLNKGVKI